jgi:NDP-hexose-3-ketoreductase
MRYLGPDLNVAGAVLRRAAPHGAVLSGSVLMHTPGGVPAQLSFGMEHSYRNRCTLVGSEARLTLDRVFTPPPAHRPVIRIERSDHSDEVVLPDDDQWRNVIRAVVAAIRRGACDPQESRSSIRQAELIDHIAAVAHYVDVPARRAAKARAVYEPEGAHAELPPIDEILSR